MANVNEGPVQTLADGGYITVWKNVGGVFGWYAVAVADVNAIKAVADGALQAGSVTDIVLEDPEAYIRVAAFQTIINGLNSTISFQAIQIANLQALIGADQIHVLADGIVEPGVVV